MLIEILLVCTATVKKHISLLTLYGIVGMQTYISETGEPWTSWQLVSSSG